MLRIAIRLCFFWAISDAIFHLKLGKDNTLYWELDYEKGELLAEVHTENLAPNGWVGVGFSNYGNLTDGSGDFCIAWTNVVNKRRSKSSKPLQLTDVHVQNGSSIIQLDHQQDCLDFQYLVENGTTKWTFRRKFITCDVFDYPFEDGTTHLHWVKGSGPLWDIKGVSLNRPGVQSGFERVRFLKPVDHQDNHQPPASRQFNPKTTTVLDVLNSNVHVPGVETTYWCKIVKIPEIFRNKHHVLQFGANIQKGNEALVHHMEVFHCEADPNKDMPLYSGPCPDSPPEIKVCSRVIGAWAMGAEPLAYPEKAGFPIGGPDFNLYVRLEIHYNNPMKKSDWIDSSGMRFWVSQKLRQYDAGVIELGLEYTDKMAIPPRQEGFPLTGICNAECTSVGFPPEGITIFASQLHTHLTGARVVTRHFRPSVTATGPDEYVELPMMNFDNHYSTHYQEIRQLKKPRIVLPGDILLTTCEFNTLDRVNITLGGFAISDEMCVNYVHYYPRSQLEVCKSSVSFASLRHYFEFMHKMEGQNIEPKGPISESYKGIKWTPFRARLLSDFYNASPIDMQCNQSDGNRFPGQWDAMGQVNLPQLQPKPHPNEECYLSLEK